MASGATKTVFLKDFLGNFLGGVDGGVDPHLLPKNKLAWAVNSTVRGGFIGPMPKIRSYNFSDGGILVIGGTDSVSHFVQNGVFQGATEKAYQPNKSSILPGPTFFALISGRLFGFTPDFSVSVAGAYVSSPGMIAVVEYTPLLSAGVPDLNSATAPQAWLGQAENYLIVQDGTTPNPLVFDGNNSFRSYSLQQAVGAFGAGIDKVVPVQGGVLSFSSTELVLEAAWLALAIGNAPVAVYAGASGITAVPASNLPAYAPGAYVGQMTLQQVAAGGNFSANLDPVLGGSQAVTAGDTVWMEVDNYPVSNLTTNIGGVYPVLYSANLTVNTADANSAQNSTGFVAGSLVAVATVAQWAAVPGSPYGSPLQPTGVTTQITSNSITPSMISAGSFTIPFGSDPYGSNSRITVITLQFQTKATTPTVTYTPIGILAANATLSGVTPVLFTAGAVYPPSSEQGATVFVGNNTANPAANLQCTITSYDASGTTYYLINQTAIAGIALASCVLKTLIGIPCGKQWAYCQGRIWTSLPDGTKFVAGDAVGGSSGTAANNFLDAILYTMQNTLLSNGGTFTIPGNYGTIRAMVIPPTMNVALGQGPLQVFTQQCVFSVNAPPDMTTWASLTSPIVTISLLNAGALSQWSTIAVNDDVLFRAPDGIRSMTIASLDFHKWNNAPCSQEVEPAINGDTPSLLNFCSAVQFDGRVIFGTLPISGTNGAYFQNAVVINLDGVGNLQEKSPAVWEGEWTGLNTLQWMSGIFGNEVRCFSFMSDGTTIGLSELHRTADGQDIAGTISTTPQFESSALFNQKENSGDRILLRLEDGEVYVKDIIGLVNFKVEFRPDYDTQWHPWYSWLVDNGDGKTPYAPRMGLGNPIGGASVSGTQYRDGYDFQVRVTMGGSGSCNFMGLAVKASVVSQTEFARPMVSAPIPAAIPVVVLKQAFAGSGAPTTQNPGSGEAGIYFDALNEEFYLWLGTEWDTGIVPTGSIVFAAGRQAFAGSGAPTAATPTPANNAGTYFDYTNQALYFWNPAGYWGNDITATGSGVVATSLGSDYLAVNGVPPATLKPANNAGLAYDTNTLTVYNWNPVTQTWI
jgi:hypothetical protein